MKLSIAKLNKMSRAQRKKRFHEYRFRNCSHPVIKWGRCQRCMKKVSIEPEPSPTWTDTQAKYYRCYKPPIVHVYPPSRISRLFTWLKRWIVRGGKK